MLEMKEIQVQSLGWEDSLELEKATHSSIFAGRIPGTEFCLTEEFIESKRVGHD